MNGTAPKNSTDVQRGLMWLVGGLVILLYAFNLFQQSLNFLVIIGGSTMAGYGFVQMGGVHRLQGLLNRFRRP